LNILEKRSAAIVGIGGIFPDAPDLGRFWDNIRHGRSAAREIPAERWHLSPDLLLSPDPGTADRLYSRSGCFIEAMPPLSSLSALNIDPELLSGLDPLFHLLLHAGNRAFNDAVTAPVNRARIGVIIGNLALPTEKSALLARQWLGRTFAEKLHASFPDQVAINPLNRYVAGLPAGLLAQALGLGGGSCTLDAACASSLYALKLAVDELISGRADAMLTGGISRPDPLYTQIGFSQLRALSARGICSPFDARGDGLVVGEGAGIFLLKRTEDAVAHGDRIYGIIRGIGLANDVGGSLLAPLSEGQLRAMRAAYAVSCWNPRDVDLIECHATGTPVGDATEFASLRELWGDAHPEGRACVIGSVKSNIGHLLTAAGAAALTKVLLAMDAGILPPTANFTEPPPAIDLEKSRFQVLKTERTWERRGDGIPRRAAISAFGFGGINAHLLVEEWLAKEPVHSVRHKRVKKPEKPIPIAVVGMDARFGPWQSFRLFQERVLGGERAAAPTRPRKWWGAEESSWLTGEGLHPTQFKGYYLDEFDIATDKFRIPPREMEDMLPQQLLMLQTAALAMADAGLDREDNLKAGVFIGIALDLNTTNFSVRWSLTEEARVWAKELAPDATPEELLEWIAALQDEVSPPLTANRTMGALGSIVASRIAREFRVGGPSFTISNEENSGIRALEAAVRLLQAGELNRALVGAVDLAGDIRAVLGHHALRPFSASGMGLPFAEEADGVIVGEGAAAVVLKRLDDAEHDGDRIYAVIRGIGSAGGATLFPGAGAYRQALERAYADAGVDPATISYIEACAGGFPSEDRMEAKALADFFAQPNPLGAASGDNGEISKGVRDTGSGMRNSCAVTGVKGEIGHCGAASGLASFVRGCLALYQEIIPPCSAGGNPVAELQSAEPFYRPATPRYWLRNRADGARRAGVSSFGVDGSCYHVVLEGWDNLPSSTEAERVAPIGRGNEFLFTLSGSTPKDLSQELDLLRHFATAKGCDLASLARQWYGRMEESPGKKPLAIAMVARNREELTALINQGTHVVADNFQESDSIEHPSLRDRLFFSLRPLGKEGKIAFVFPGSGNHYPGMGMELSSLWPDVFRRRDAENLYLRSQFQPELFWNGATLSEINDDPQAIIFSQVATGCAVSDIVRCFGVEPQAVIGYSLGESAGLFALDAWRNRDGMLARMRRSTLFTHDLAGEFRAARRAWGIGAGKEVEWRIGVVEAPEREVRKALETIKRAYLLIVNTCDECVIGGDAQDVEFLVARLGCRFYPLQGVTTAHCEVARQVAVKYRELHLFETTPPPGITFYSGAWGRSYDVDRQSAADSMLSQAVEGIDFPRMIESAYADGIRLFIELGPGSSCSRMISRILSGRPHLARAACCKEIEPSSSILRLLGQLVSEGVEVNLGPLFPVATSLSLPIPNCDPLRNPVRVKFGGKSFKPPILAMRTAIPAKPLDEIRGSISPPLPLPSTSKDGGERFEPSDNTNFNHNPGSLYNGKVEPISHGHRDNAADSSRLSIAPLLHGFAAAQEARLLAHDAFLRLSEQLNKSMGDAIALQISLREELGDEFISHHSPLLKEEGTKVSASSEPVLSNIAFNREMCLEFARGSVARMLGPEFSEADTFPTRVRLPDEPLMLVDRIVALEGEARSMTWGRVATEHDILANAWYLDAGRIPTCIAVEAGQADLFLSGYLGIDFITRGLAVYRLLDAVVTFHRSLPGEGETIHYDISIERFFQQGETYFFRFRFDATVNGMPLLTMRDGCAGFFTAADLDAGRGIVRGAIDLRPCSGRIPVDWEELVPLAPESYSSSQLDLLREGDLAGCFGQLFNGLDLKRPLTLPGGRMRLVHRVIELNPTGGRYGIGLIRAEADILPDDWFLTCHFVDDRVMPGTLMYECCLHTLRIYLLRMGWVAETADSAWEPSPGVMSRLSCRGQVLETTKTVAYEVSIRELGYQPEPYAIVDALMYADAKPIVEITSMSIRLSGTTREQLKALWQRRICKDEPLPDSAYAGRRKPALYTKDQILAYSNGNPSEGFGEPYRIFDRDRIIARLPAPPFQFMDRVTVVKGEPWQMNPGAMAETQYDIPPDAWYFDSGQQARMPFAVLLESALQPCGWLAAYVGSALTSPVDLSFRNLGGSAIQHRPVTPESGLLTATTELKKVSASGGMIIQEFAFSVADCLGTIYEGETMFGFFSREALHNQLGIRDAAPYLPTDEEVKRGLSCPYPENSPFPNKMLRMVDRIELFVPDGGPARLGYVRGVKDVDPGEWFFKAHFYQDPVTPGSLGLEAFLQLLEFVVVERWGWSEGNTFSSVALKHRHKWLYRGQILPSDTQVKVESWITFVDDRERLLTADGFLSVDGRVIYRMNDFTVQME
jgi:PfaB family protein